VSVLAFNVRRCRGTIVIRWRVELPAGDVGFNVYRSDTGGRSLERVHAVIIRVSASGISSFEIADAAVATDSGRDYWLELVDAEGCTRIWGPRRAAG
jgi:hypothetical protein